MNDRIAERCGIFLKVTLRRGSGLFPPDAIHPRGLPRGILNVGNNVWFFIVESAR